MLALLARNWWALALRGIAALLFGIAALVWTDITLTVLILLFGVYVLIDGIFNLIAALRGRRRYAQWWIVLLAALAAIAVAVLTFVWPGITALAMVYLIAAWLVVAGVLQVVMAVRLRREITGEWLLVLGGLVSIGVGIAMLIWPGPGALAIIWLIAAYEIVSGLLLFMLSLRLRRVYKELHPTGD